MDEAKANVLPEIGSLISAPAGKEAFVTAKLKKDSQEMGYSVTARKDDNGQWTLNYKDKGGLRILLTSGAPKEPVRTVKVTHFCKALTCVFGVLANGETNEVSTN